MDDLITFYLKKKGWEFVKEQDVSLTSENCIMILKKGHNHHEIIFSMCLIYLKYRLAKGIFDLLKKNFSSIPEEEFKERETILLAENKKLGLKFFKIIRIHKKEY